VDRIQRLFQNLEDLNENSESDSDLENDRNNFEEEEVGNERILEEDDEDELENENYHSDSENSIIIESPPETFVTPPESNSDRDESDESDDEQPTVRRHKIQVPTSRILEK
jgi:hypothetical protein